MNEKKIAEEPLSFKLSLWHGYIFSGIFLLYGGVQIVLAILDRTYTTMGQLIMFAALGLLLLMVVLMYAERKIFGWYCVIGMNILIVIFSLIGYSQYENIVLFVLSAISLYMLNKEETRKYL